MRPVTQIAIAFTVLAGASLLSAEGLAGAHAASLAILGIAGVKAAIIASEFMELRHAHRGLAIGFTAWLIAVLTMLGWFYSTSAA